MRAPGRNAPPGLTAEHAHPVLRAEHDAWGAECSRALSLPALSLPALSLPALSLPVLSLLALSLPAPQLPALQVELAAGSGAVVGMDLSRRLQERLQAGALQAGTLFVPTTAAQRKR